MVRRIADFVTKYCFIVFGIFLVLAAFSAFLSTKVKINHDIYSYMPESSETSQGLKTMKDEFNYGSTSTWQMMFEDLSDDEKSEVKEYLESVENVESVSQDEKDNYVRFEIVLNVSADSEEANKAYNIIYNELKPKYTFYQTGEVYSNNATVVSIIITVFAVGTAMVILTVMSESFVEPWLYLFAILIAVVLNKGTNIIFPSVSHITDSISMVLQMALSMDYAIMLSSRYRQEKASKDRPSKYLAMNRALRYSFGAISSSSITTVVGLIVLVFMSFTIGRDMGFVLSKGVVLSLVSIFTILPALLLLFDKAIEKTHKKTLNFKMNFLGDKEHRFRKIALPVFAIVFGAAFFLKGNTSILFTDSENNKIKDVFPVVNQTAIVYGNEDEKKLAEVCKKYEKNEDVKRILCYSNTIGEQEKYDEIIAKANELNGLKVSGQSAGNGETVEAEDYLVKAIYYFYYRGDNHAVTLPTFAKFVRDTVLNDKNVNSDISPAMRANVIRLAKFVIPEEAAKARGKAEIADLLGVGQSKLDELYTLYLAKHPTGVRMTLGQFANFVSKDILNNSEYSKMVTAAQREDLKKLMALSDASIPSAATPEELLNFMLSNEVMGSEMGITSEQARAAINTINDFKTKAEPYLAEHPELAEALLPLTKKYSYKEYITFAEQVSQILNQAKDKIEEINEKYELGIELTSIPQIDLKTKLDRLKQAEYIVDNRNTKYSAWELSKAFGLDYEKIKLAYALYDYRYVTRDPMLSIERVVNILTDEVFEDLQFSSRLDDAQKNKVRVVAGLMQSSRMGVSYNYDGLYNALLPLGEKLDKNQIFLAYIYHGSIYDYDKKWTLSLEEFVNFLNQKVLDDSRFSGRLDDDMRKTIVDAKETIDDAKAVLVGPRHSRVLIETELEAEGEKTFSFLKGIKDELGETKHFLVGDSAMAYEMSKTFSSEMDFITILTMISIFVVVAFTFKSILIPLLLVLVIQSAVYINMAFLSLTGQSIYFIALIIVQSILMGATIDYAILYTSYYLENRGYGGLGVKDAITSSYNKSMHSILTSASILILVTAIVGNMASAIAAKICQSISVGTMVATLIILLLLPALLVTIDKFIVKKK